VIFPFMHIIYFDHFHSLYNSFLELQGFPRKARWTDSRWVVTGRGVKENVERRASE
jgi:hypothetical protein